MRKLYTINTVNNYVDIILKPFGIPFAQRHADVAVYNIMDDSLLKDLLAAGAMRPDIAARMLNYAMAAQNSGADGVLVTCTSVNEATDIIRPLLNIPILNIEEPAAEEAVLAGRRIGVLATLPTSPAAIGRTIYRMAQKHGREVELVNRVVDGAFDVLCAGNRAKHDEMVNEALNQLAREVDVVAFAQISMSLLKHDDVAVPLCKIGSSGFEKINRLMKER